MGRSRINFEWEGSSGCLTNDVDSNDQPDINRGEAKMEEIQNEFGRSYDENSLRQENNQRSNLSSFMNTEELIKLFTNNENADAKT